MESAGLRTLAERRRCPSVGLTPGAGRFLKCEAFGRPVIARFASGWRHRPAWRRPRVDRRRVEDADRHVEPERDCSQQAQIRVGRAEETAAGPLDA